MREHGADVVGRGGDVREAQHGQGAVRRLLDQLDGRLQNRRERPLAADDGARDVQAALGQQLVEVVARDAAREVREAGADGAGVAVAQGGQPASRPGGAAPRPSVARVPS